MPSPRLFFNQTAAGQHFITEALKLAETDNRMPPGSLVLANTGHNNTVLITPRIPSPDGALLNYGQVGSHYWCELVSRAGAINFLRHLGVKGKLEALQNG